MSTKEWFGGLRTVTDICGNTKTNQNATSGRKKKRETEQNKFRLHLKMATV